MGLAVCGFAASSTTRYTRTGSGMFLTSRSPRSSKSRSSLPSTWLWTSPEMPIANISTSGALIEPSSTTAGPGERMGITIFYWTEGAQVCSMDLSAEVVRTTRTGFAVRF